MSNAIRYRLAGAFIGLIKVAGFVLVVTCAIVSFYAVIHTININSQINVFFAGLMGLLIGVVTGPLYCLIATYGMTHYFGVALLGATLLVLPVLAAWLYMVFSLAAGYIRG